MFRHILCLPTPLYIVPADVMGVVVMCVQSEQIERCATPMSCAKCIEKTYYMTYDLCNDMGPLQSFRLSKLQNMTCELTHTLQISFFAGILLYVPRVH